MTPYYAQDGVTVFHARCEDVLPTLEANSVDLVCVDPPYFKVKGEDWDQQWATPALFLAWLDGMMAEVYRVLKPNGSIYCFASPQMAARVECQIAGRFNVLNTITWSKPAFSTKAEMFDKASCRAFFPASERTIFAEHSGADNIAKGEAGYEAKCDELRGFIFEPIRKYLDDERIAAGFTPEDCNEACGHRREGGMAGRHYFSPSQWCLPTADNYRKMREAFNRDWNGEHLRRDYEELRRDYEELRRPFTVTADVPYTDVWTFKTVPVSAGKHPCEKPIPLLEHIISASTKPGATVLDFCCGSGSTLVAAHRLGRTAIGIDQDQRWCRTAAEWLAQGRLAFGT